MNRSQGKAVKITREIFQIGGSQLSRPEDAAIYLINFDGHAVRLKKLGSFKKIDVPVFISKNKATTEMSSRQEGKL
jgi:hypothetical protein